MISKRVADVMKGVATKEKKAKRVLSPEFKAQIGKGHDNLIPFTKETAQAARLKGLRTRQAQAKAKEDFVNRIKVYHAVMHRLPEVDAEKVIRLRIHMALQEQDFETAPSPNGQQSQSPALQEQDFETAAHWAKELMEFQRPKLARKEVVLDNNLEKMSLAELKKMAAEEGLL